ncbi:MAG: ATP-dependent Clp protease adaptor ClpS [Desulfobacterales bacterium]|nr:ATP-dependent Clp protease adaptor ClpS [Desulfobacterales bacterium]MDD4071164.1 ATP-dependent Clp protease adaptor ClpS [Desulfobacterales bacterium]MDD4393370.1 ATP-dependent Clp protease adaptor ClpS [Desulfobacterales bacterium]
MSAEKPFGEEDISSSTQQIQHEPSLYRVLLHNDDYTTMEFVVDILRIVFYKSAEEAVRVMLHVHQQGIGVCGAYPFEIAETRMDTVHALARDRGFPLKCSMEKI